MEPTTPAPVEPTTSAPVEPTTPICQRLLSQFESIQQRLKSLNSVKLDILHRISYEEELLRKANRLPGKCRRNCNRLVGQTKFKQREINKLIRELRHRLKDIQRRITHLYQRLIKNRERLNRKSCDLSSVALWLSG